MDINATPRTVLRAMQARWTNDPVIVGAQDSQIEQTMQELASWEAANRDVQAHRADGEAGHRRMSQTREILNRIQPGPLENTKMIVALAWQSAAIELEVLDREPSATWTMPLFGTTWEPRSHAATVVVRGVPVAVLSAGLISSCYTVAKAAVLAWLQKPKTPDPTPAFSAHPIDTSDSLDANAMPVTLMVSMATNWLRDGLAHLGGQWPVPDMYINSLARLVSDAERFILAHEYWHAILESAVDRDVDQAERENLADDFAQRITIATAERYDRQSADISMQGCLLALEVYSIVDDLIGLVRPATLSTPQTATHLPFVARAQRLVDGYNATHVRTGKVSTHLSVVAAAANAASQIWLRARPEIARQIYSGIDIHPVWGM